MAANGARRTGHRSVAWPSRPAMARRPSYRDFPPFTIEFRIREYSSTIRFGGRRRQAGGRFTSHAGFQNEML